MAHTANLYSSNQSKQKQLYSKTSLKLDPICWILVKVDTFRDSDISRLILKLIQLFGEVTNATWTCFQNIDDCVSCQYAVTTCPLIIVCLDLPSALTQSF